MLRGVWGDEERFRETYWKRFAKQGYYFAGDGAKYDDGAIWLLGRIDDIMLVHLNATNSDRTSDLRWRALIVVGSAAAIAARCTQVGFCTALRA
jgi:hypothetical protein